MATVPTAGTTQGGIPVVNQLNLGQGIAQAIGQAAGAAAGIGAQVTAQKQKESREFEERRQKQRSREEFDGAFAAYSRDLDDLGAESIRGDDIPSITSNFEKGAETLRAEALKTIKSTSARNRFNSSSQQLLTSHRASISGQQIKREQQAGRQILKSSLGEMSSSAIISRDPAISDQIEFTALQMIDESEHILSENKPAAKKEWLAGVELGGITQLIDLADASQDEGEALGHLAVAAEILSDPENMPNTDPAARTAVRRQVENERQDAVRRFNQVEIRNLHSDIDDASTGQDAVSAIQRIDRLAEIGAIGPERAIRFDNQLEKRFETLRSADSGAARIEMKIANGIPIDPKNKKDIDAYVDEIFLKEIEGKPADEQNAAIVDLVGEMDVLPSRFERSMRAVASNGTADEVAATAQMYIALKDASPQAMERIDRELNAFLSNMNESMELNQSAENALRINREIAKLSPSIRKGRGDSYRVIQQDVSDAQWLQDQASGGLFKDAAFRIEVPFGFDISADDVDSGVLSMFSAEVNRQYMVDDNIDRARGRALEAMSRVVGVTAVGGEPRVAILPPELRYPGFMGDSAEITRQVIVDVRSAGVEDLAELSDDALSDRLILVADADSYREFDPDTGLLEPGYSVYLLGDDELDMPRLLEMPDGGQLRFHPDDGLKQRREEAQNLIEAREAHQVSQSVSAARKSRRKDSAESEDAAREALIESQGGAGKSLRPPRLGAGITEGITDAIEAFIEGPGTGTLIPRGQSPKVVPGGSR